MNPYIKNLNKIEFVVTYACSGRCKHCSEGEHSACGEFIDPKIASDAVRKIASRYDIKTVMTFGGEPLLHWRAVTEIMKAAKSMNIPHRQVITNGYFSNSIDEIKQVAAALGECGVNDVLLSVDAFHQETIPLEAVKTFAKEIVAVGISLRLSPAWLVSPADDNPYNNKTREILEAFGDIKVKIGEGNIVFPEGNALKYLSEYFKCNIPENPYIENPKDVKCVSFAPNGDVLGKNVYSTDIMEIIDKYKNDLKQ